MSSNRCKEYQVPSAASEQVWDSLNEAGAFVTRADGRPFVFASGREAAIKIDAERVQRHPDIIRTLVGVYAAHLCTLDAEALSFVPNGARFLAEKIAAYTGKVLIDLVRPEGARRDDIHFATEQDLDMTDPTILNGPICLIEDVTTTSVSAWYAAGTLRLINPDLEVHSVSALQRGRVAAEYQSGPDGITYHTLLERAVPLDLTTFRQQYPQVTVHEVE